MHQITKQVETTQDHLITETQIAIANSEQRTVAEAVVQTWQEKENLVALTEHAIEQERMQSRTCIGNLTQMEIQQSEGNRVLKERVKYDEEKRQATIHWYGASSNPSNTNSTARKRSTIRVAKSVD